MISSVIQKHRRRVPVRILFLINLAALLAAWMCIGGAALAVYAQERSVTVAGTYSHSPGTGHKDGWGVLSEFVLVVPQLDRFKLVTGAQYEIAPKSYLGNGSATRAYTQLRYVIGPGKWAVQPFVLGGGSVVNNHTTGPGGYSKTAWFAVAGAGVNFNDRVIPAWEHYFREHQTQNLGASDKFKLDLYLPLSKDSKWLARMQIFGQRSTFTQPNGPAAGQHVAWSYGGFIGIGYRWK